MKQVTQEILDFAMATDFKDLPEAVVHESKRILLDSIGCALGGLGIDKGKISVGLAKRLGGPPEASILGLGDRISCAGAAFANGELILALEYDENLVPPTHVTPLVVPSVLALAEYMGSSGKDLILSTALAHEVAMRLGFGMTTARKFITEGPDRGKFILPPVFGYSQAIFGGTIGAGRILKLDYDKMSNAVGIAGYNTPIPTMGKWLRTGTGGMVKYVAAGWISQAEVTAVLLAEMGYTGDQTVLEGEYGFWRIYGSETWKPEKVIEKLGKEWHMTEMWYKLYPTGGIMHSALDCFSKIIEENSLYPEDIEEVSVLLDPLTDHPRFQRKEVETQIDAQFSVPYAFAVRAHNIPIGVEWQHLETIRDPKIREFMKKVTIHPHPEFGKVYLENPKCWLSCVEVKAKGKTFIEEGISAKGRPYPEESRATDGDLVKKFQHNASFILPCHKIDNASKIILELEEIQNISDLIKLVTI